MTSPRISYVPYEDMDERMQAEMDRSAREGTPRPESNAVRAHVPAAGGPLVVEHGHLLPDLGGRLSSELYVLLWCIAVAVRLDASLRRRRQGHRGRNERGQQERGTRHQSSHARR